VKQTAPDIPLTFEGSSQELKATEVVPTLDTPIPKGKNAIWCASFPSAWKALEELAGEPIRFRERPEMAGQLNAADDPRPHIPPASLYTASGWNQQGITNQIWRDLEQRFPGKKAPTFEAITPDSFVAYAYLEANVRFPIPYDQNPQPLVFAEGGGNQVEIHSFGVSKDNHNDRDKIWKQPRVLFRKGEPGDDDFEFALDLCSSSPTSQVVVARIAAQPTLEGALARVESGIAAMPELIEQRSARSGSRMGDRLLEFNSTDALWVPDFHWSISHRFLQLEGSEFTNAKLRGQRMDIAQQDIRFCLDRSGATLRSEAKTEKSAIPTNFFFERPFLVYMKKRGAPIPYFAMWVDNAELLRRRDGAGKPGVN
jgi:hypothetical protein